MILENYRETTDYKAETVKETAKQNNHSDKVEREILHQEKLLKRGH